MELQTQRMLPTPEAADALDEAIRSILGVKFSGINARNEQVFLILRDDATADEQNTALTIANAHDFSTRLPRQLERVQRKTDFDEVLAAKAAAALTQITNDLATLGGSPTNPQLIQILTRTIQRQEKIIKALAFVADKVG